MHAWSIVEELDPHLEDVYSCFSCVNQRVKLLEIRHHATFYSTKVMEDAKQLKFDTAIDPDFRNLIETDVKINLGIGLSYVVYIDKKLHKIRQ